MKKQNTRILADLKTSCMLRLLRILKVTGILLLVFSFHLFAQTSTITGTVTDRSGEVLIGASVADKELMESRPVGMPHLNMGSISADPDWPDYGYTLSDVLYEIRRERVTELYGEGFRFDDLMRWRAHNMIIGHRFTGTYYTAELRGVDPNMPVNVRGYLDPLMNILTGPGNGYGFNPNRDYLLPLPTNELTLNPNLKQNPGW